MKQPAHSVACSVRVHLYVSENVCMGLHMLGAGVSAPLSHCLRSWCPAAEEIMLMLLPEQFGGLPEELLLCRAGPQPLAKLKACKLTFNSKSCHVTTAWLEPRNMTQRNRDGQVNGRKRKEGGGRRANIWLTLLTQNIQYMVLNLNTQIGTEMYKQLRLHFVKLYHLLESLLHQLLRFKLKSKELQLNRRKLKIVPRCDFLYISTSQQRCQMG